jgi:hypothetical protein
MHHEDPHAESRAEINAPGARLQRKGPRLMQIRPVISILSVVAFVVAKASIASAAGQDTGTAIPEPGTLALLTTGAAGLVGASWWIRRK